MDGRTGRWLTEAFRRGVLKLFVERELFEPEVAEGMLERLHSGFSVHDSGSMLAELETSIGQVDCADCHDPHTMHGGSAAAPAVPPNFGEVPGVSGSGARHSRSTP